MKVKCLLLLVFLDFCRTSLAASAINESDVKSYVVERRTGGYYDLFTVNMKDGHQCTTAHKVSEWCTLFSATYDDSSWSNASSCSCACPPSFPSFLPSLQTSCMSNVTLAAKFGGCQDYFDGRTLLKYPVDLQSNGNKAMSISSDDYNNCSLHMHGHYFDYNGFQSKWQTMIHGIFSLKKQRAKRKFSIVWVADTAGKLSGRIIRLNLTCKSERRPSNIRSRCMLFKALGTVTYYSSTSESSVNQSSYLAVPTSVNSHVPLPSVTYSSTPPPSQPSLSHVPSPPQSLSLTSPALTSSAPSGIPSFFSPSHSQTSSLHTMPTSLTSGPIDLSTSRMELPSSLPFHSVEASDKLVSTGIPIPIISTVGPDPIESSKPSTEASSSSAVIVGPGDKKRQSGGNGNGVVIGAVVGGAVVFGILVMIMIILFCKRRKMGKSKEKATKLEVKNPVYGTDNDIQMGQTRGKQVTTSNEQDNQPTYQGLTIDSGQVDGAALYSSPEDNYDNYTVYQSLDKQVPGSPVYQSLKKGQAATGDPKPGRTGHPRKKHNQYVTPEPVYNALEQPGTEQGKVEESLYNVLEGPEPEKDYEAAERDNHGDTQDPLYNVLDGPDPEKDYEATERDNHGDTQDPLYNVLDGPDAEQNYEAVNVGNASVGPLYNVVEGPESTQDRQEPLYNVLESADAENSPPGRQGPYDGSNNEPLYNVVEGPDSGGPNKSSADYAAPNGPLSPDGHDNPAYEQTLELDAPYASVYRPGPQRESVYEPLMGPDHRHDLYEPLSKRGT